MAPNQTGDETKVGPEPTVEARKPVALFSASKGQNHLRLVTTIPATTEECPWLGDRISEARAPHR